MQDLRGSKYDIDPSNGAKNQTEFLRKVRA